MIRPASAEDRPAAGRLWAESWRAAHAGAVSPAYAAAQTPRLYAEQLLAPGIEAYVEEADGVLRGVLRLDTAAGEVQTLYVAPDCQGRGVGGALLRRGAAAGPGPPALAGRAVRERAGARRLRALRLPAHGGGDRAGQGAGHPGTEVSL